MIQDVAELVILVSLPKLSLQHQIRFLKTQQLNLA
jgi:hypothetical protein